ARPLQLERDVSRHAAMPDLPLVDEPRELANVLNYLVVVVLGRDELRAIEDGEQLRIIDSKDRRLQPAREPRSERLVYVAACDPVVIGIGRRYPDHRHRLGVDLAGLDLMLPNEVVDNADLVGTRLHELDRAAVVAGVADAREDLLGVFAKRLADEMLRKQA